MKKNEEFKLETSFDGKTLSVETSSTTHQERLSSITSSSNQPSPKFRKNTPIDKIRESLISYGVKGGAQKERVIETTENVLKQAQGDPAVMKGLI